MEEYLPIVEKLATSLDSDILKAFRHIIFKRRGDIRKGDLSKGMEEAMLLYIREYVEMQAGFAVANALMDTEMSKKLAVMGMDERQAISTILLIGFAMYQEMPKQMLKELDFLIAQNDGKISIADAVKQVLPRYLVNSQKQAVK